jgi:hypothetical protein
MDFIGIDELVALTVSRREKTLDEVPIIDRSLRIYQIAFMRAIPPRMKKPATRANPEPLFTRMSNRESTSGGNDYVCATSAIMAGCVTPPP